MISFSGSILLLLAFAIFVIWDFFYLKNQCPVCGTQMKYSKVSDMKICPYCYYPTKHIDDEKYRTIFKK